jgi:ADP-ribose pyrophosphatase YjhB (NUDIX family)
MTTSYVQTCQTRPFAVTTQFAACGVVYRWTTNAFVEFLLIKKRGDWTLPKGQLLEGEPADVAALREVAEETGLRGVLHGELLRTLYPVVKGGQVIHKQLIYFLVRVVDGTERPQFNERITMLRWCTLIAALRLLRQSHHRVAVLAAAERLASDAMEAGHPGNLYRP